MNNRTLEQMRGGLWALITGDALGVPVEFEDRRMLEPNPVIHMRGYGSHHQEPGTWSDDSSMMLAAMDSLKRALVTAVNLGDDSDTMGSVTGGLAGTWYGYGQIPEDWLSELARREWIEELVEKFLASLS